MNQDTQFHECCRAFAQSYEISTLPAMRDVERTVLGCDYGGTSWTTRAQAAEIARALVLRPGVNLLEIGAGSGWPGIYIAGESGCNVTLVDLPVTALAKATRRARNEGHEEQVSAVAASGNALPFRDATFDAIGHSDVLCCLPEKNEMLAECRRVAADNARMSFFVIFAPSELPEADYGVAVRTGPPFVDAPAPYAALLRNTGWWIESVTDVTSDYLGSLRQMVRGIEKSSELVEALGQEAVAETIRHRKEQIDAVERGLLRREVYLAIAT